jgi:23S rRNA (uracil747-C5)-methyltransferase
MKVDSLKEFFDKAKITVPIKSNKIIEYRNKAKFIVGGDLDNPVVGIPSPSNIKVVSPLVDCPLHTNSINNIALLIKDLICEYKLTPYDINSKSGEFKYLIISEGHETGELSIRFGMRSLESFERVSKLYSYLITTNPNLLVCSFEVQPKHAAIFEGEERFLSSKKYIQHDFGDIQLSSSTSNFFQVNSEVAKKLYDKVYARFKDENINTAVDLFCGVGGFAQQLSRFSSRVYGIEINQVAIDCAKHSASINNLKNIEFICDDANNFENHIKDEVDLVVVNPPRRGIGIDLCKIITKINPKFLVYSSCNPKTLAADIKILSRDYSIESLTPIDMFPLTNHLEVLCILVRI